MDQVGGLAVVVEQVRVVVVESMLAPAAVAVVVLVIGYSTVLQVRLVAAYLMPEVAYPQQRVSRLVDLRRLLDRK